MRKKIVVWILAFALACSVTACSNAEDSDTDGAVTGSASQEGGTDAEEDGSPEEAAESTALEENPEYIALREKISQSKAGVPDENGNYTIGTYVDLHSASIRLLPDQAFDISATNYLITENLDAEDTDYTQVQYAFPENATTEKMEQAATSEEPYQKDDYSEVEMGSVQTADVNGMTISWVKNSYVYRYFTQYTQFYGWTEVDDHTIFMISIEICGDVGMTVEDGILTEAFKGVTLS